MELRADPASFRDPSGFVFKADGQLYRNISESYRSDFELATHSGLYEKLISAKLLVAHEIVSFDHRIPDSFAVVKPQQLTPITYPHEWCFSQLKDAALLTLEVLTISLNHGMILKDASGFNVQIVGSCPLFIDTLSFTKYREGQPWQGYRQFCEHFLAPLTLAAFVNVNLLSLLRLGCDGINLGYTSMILPKKSWFNSGTLFHIHLHAKSIAHFSDKLKKRRSQNTISKVRLMGMIDHLKTFVESLKLKTSDRTQWQDYDQETHYSPSAKKSKEQLVKQFLDIAKPGVVWDIGANDGFFSRAIASKSRTVLSLDADYMAVEKNYLQLKKHEINSVYALYFDIVNPSADMGWANRERLRLEKRSHPDCIIALAVLHHVAITHNIPLANIADYLSELAKWLLIEFVPENDEKIKALPDTAGKKAYTINNFRAAFYSRYDVISEQEIENSGRTLILMKRK